MSSKTLKLRGKNEGNNFENSKDSCKILKNWPMNDYSEQGHREVSNIGGAPIQLYKSHIKILNGYK